MHLLALFRSACELGDTDKVGGVQEPAQ
jgi:hypothetical protein